MTETTLIDIRDYFSMTSSEFADEWKELSSEDKDYFRQAVGEELGE